MPQTTLTFIGTDSVVPRSENDTTIPILGRDVCLCQHCLL